MARRKAIFTIKTPDVIAEMCRRYKVDPLEQMFQMLTWRERLPDNVPEKILKEITQDFEITQDETGQKWTVPKMKLRFEIAKEITGYVHAKKKPSEVKEEGGYTLNVTIKTFEPVADENRTITIEPVKALAEPEEI